MAEPEPPLRLSARILRSELAKKTNDNLSPEIIEVLRQDFERLLASFWRPIETAPTTQEFLAWVPDEDDEEYGGMVHIAVRYAVSRPVQPAGFYEVFGEGVMERLEPTHWMPLPDGPK